MSHTYSTYSYGGSSGSSNDSSGSNSHSMHSNVPSYSVQSGNHLDTHPRRVSERAAMCSATGLPLTTVYEEDSMCGATGLPFVPPPKRLRQKTACGTKRSADTNSDFVALAPSKRWSPSASPATHTYQRNISGGGDHGSHGGNALYSIFTHTHNLCTTDSRPHESSMPLNTLLDDVPECSTPQGP